MVSTAPDQLDIDDRETTALTRREYTFISRVHQICVWLAREDRTKVVKRIVSEWHLAEADAELWINKAEDFMASMAMDGIEDARQMYVFRLSTIYNLCMANVQKDAVEVTTKPIRVVLEHRDADGNATHDLQRKVITGEVTKVKLNAFDAGAVSAALKAAREAAFVCGARPVARRGGGLFGAVGQVNLQINSGNGGAVVGAQTCNDLANDQLAALVGAEYVEVLPAGQGSDAIIDVKPVSGENH